ncbi:type II toxin-antitoxin system HigB family toxin, partial [Halomonas sp. BM-2019]|uniref:type II toxin-antitoxin system HigB family toxin n=1 Tax=Halomonas sp. BM-2019 TaxID=2811227 RepID=UPI0031FE046F
KKETFWLSWRCRQGGAMRIITRKAFNDAARQHPNDAPSQQRVYRLLSSSDFQTPDKLRQALPSLDNFRYRDRWWVIDIAGNNLRLIAFISFELQVLYTKHIVTHAEYDKLCRQYARGSNQ